MMLLIVNDGSNCDYGDDDEVNAAVGAGGDAVH